MGRNRRFSSESEPAQVHVPRDAFPAGAGNFVPYNAAVTPFTQQSDYASRERTVRSQIREWYYQRKAGGKYMLWSPPGVVFAKLSEYHWDTGPNQVPRLSDWWFSGQALPEKTEEGRLRQKAERKGKMQSLMPQSAPAAGSSARFQGFPKTIQHGSHRKKVPQKVDQKLFQMDYLLFIVVTVAKTNGWDYFQD